MCEFKVILRKDGKEDVVLAEDVVYSKTAGEELVMKDVLGVATKLKDTVICEVDVGKERMVVAQNPIFYKILSFVELSESLKEENKYSQEVEEAWNEIKAFGDELVRSLWMKGKSGKR